MLTISLIGLLLLATLAITLLVLKLRRIVAAHSTLMQTQADLEDRFRPVVDADAERKRVLDEIEAERARLRAETTEAENAKQRSLAEADTGKQRVLHDARAPGEAPGGEEEQRRIREQMREEEQAQRELARAQGEAEREEKRYADALRKATDDAQRAVGDKQQRLLGQIEELQQRLAEAQANKERAIARAQMTRSGHVYVISNVGSFSEQIYKIGMTRRLDPMDRVRELGDASVPFQFDVHAIIYSDDAPTLENTLHREFHLRRVNRVNLRREFFRASIEEIAEAVHRHHGEIEFTLAAEAVEYRKTLALLDEEQLRPTERAASSVAVTQASTVAV